jgi:hypothetical protein
VPTRGHENKTGIENKTATQFSGEEVMVRVVRETLALASVSAFVWMVFSAAALVA